MGQNPSPTEVYLIISPLSSETLFRISGEAFEREHHRADKTGWIKVLFEGAALPNFQLARTIF